MRYDPKRLEDAKTPSLEGFSTFVTTVLLRDPDAWYWWRSCGGCAVGQYLKSIDCYNEHWYDHGDDDDISHLYYPKDQLKTLAALNDLAHGPYPVRDGRGQFVCTDRSLPKPIPQWSYRTLAKRIEAKRHIATMAQP